MWRTYNNKEYYRPMKNIKDLEEWIDFDKNPEKLKEYNFCPVPFTSLYSNFSDGKVRPCCVFSDYETLNKDELFKNPKYFNQELKRIWEGDKWQKIRESFLKNEWPTKGCETCQDREKRGMRSDRFTHLQRNYDYLKDNYKELDVVKGNNLETPYDLDLRPSNLCNLTCRMCTTVNSSKINDDVEKNPELKEFFGTSSYPAYDGEKTSKIIEEGLDLTHVKYIKLLGGEPLADKGVVKILKFLVDSGKAKEVTLNMTTNATLTDRYFDLLSKFKKISLTISLEGTGKTFEYIRDPADWEKCRTNLEQIRNVPTESYIGINLVFQMYNALTVDQWLPWFIEDWQHNYYNVGNSGPCNVMRIRNKDWLCPSLLDDDDKEWFRNELNKMKKFYKIDKNDPKAKPWYELNRKSKHAYKKLIQPFEVLLDVPLGEGFWRYNNNPRVPANAAAKELLAKHTGTMDRTKWPILDNYPLPTREELLDIFKRQTIAYDKVKETNLLDLSPKFEKYLE